MRTLTLPLNAVGCCQIFRFDKDVATHQIFFCNSYLYLTQITIFRITAILPLQDKTVL